MKRLLILASLGAFFVVSSGGCIFVTKKPAHRSSSSRAHCKPSHHWDGHKCVHNGKGRGARKHDY